MNVYNFKRTKRFTRNIKKELKKMSLKIDFLYDKLNSHTELNFENRSTRTRPHNKINNALKTEECFLEIMRKYLGYYQNEFCIVLGIPYQVYCKIVTGYRKIDYENRKNIIKFIDDMKANKNIDFAKILKDNDSYKEFIMKGE